jgi:hypothetical protein
VQYLSDWILNNAVTQISAEQHTLLKAITIYKMPLFVFLIKRFRNLTLATALEIVLRRFVNAHNQSARHFGGNK